MSTIHLRQRLVDIAKRDVGKVEISHNRAPWLSKVWPATDIPNGMQLRYPYCAAYIAYCMREWLKDKEVLAQLKLTPDMAERWRGKTAGAFAWESWARSRQVAAEKEAKARENPGYKPDSKKFQSAAFDANKQIYIINEKQDRLERKPRQRLRLGDLFIFDGSHIGIVISDSANIVSTVEANTSASGSREGDGVWLKQRDRKEARFFVRFMDP